MNRSEIEKHIGKIVTLDLVNGKELTTRIKAVGSMTKSGTITVTCARGLMFVPIPDQHNPQNMQIMALPYGHPLYDAGDLLNINSEHIITIFTPSQEQQDSYSKHTGSIVAAPASALNQLGDIDFSKFKL